MSRLSIEIDPEQHRQIKTLATFAGLSIKDYILSRTLPVITESKETTQKLLEHPKNAARLREAVSAPSSKHIVFHSLKELENALGI